MTAFDHPLPSSADLAAMRRSIGDLFPHEGHNSFTDPKTHGAFLDEIANGIGYRAPWPVVGMAPLAHILDYRYATDIMRRKAYAGSYGHPETDTGVLTFTPHAHVIIAPPDPAMGTCGICGLRGYACRSAEQDDSADSSAPLARCLPSVDLDVVRALQFCDIETAAVAY